MSDTTMTLDDNEVLSPSDWRSIRPWTSHLCLSMREITSVSATFILSSSLNGDHNPSSDHLEASVVSVLAEEDGGSDVPRAAIISETLAKGLSVNVNGSAWQRVLIRVDEKADEAVIIIFGLMPGRQYDIDLGLVQDGQNGNIHKQVMTEETALSESVSIDAGDQILSEGVTSPSSVLPTPNTPTSAGPTLTSSGNGAATPTASPTPLTLEEYYSSLNHSLSLIHIERDSLSATLKSARRDAQKADAALRAEIDALRRAAEKHAAADARARQKVRALAEAVKRAQGAAEETEAEIAEVENELPDAKKKEDEKENEYTRVKEECERLTEEREKELEGERKKVEVMKGEFAGLSNRLEKLNGKKDKLTGNVIPDLEGELRKIEEEIERIEGDPYGYTAALPDIDGPSLPDDSAEPSIQADTRPRIPQPPHTHPPGPIARPGPVQRPSQHHQSRIPPQTARQLQLLASRPQFHTRSGSARVAHSNIASSNANANLSAQQHQQRQSTSSGSGSTSSSSPSPTTTPASSSTLSSRAPPFEPRLPVHRNIQSESSVGGGKWPRVSNEQT